MTDTVAPATYKKSFATLMANSQKLRDQQADPDIDGLADTMRESAAAVKACHARLQAAADAMKEAVESVTASRPVGGGEGNRG